MTPAIFLILYPFKLAQCVSWWKRAQRNAWRPRKGQVWTEEGHITNHVSSWTLLQQHSKCWLTVYRLSINAARSALQFTDTSLHTITDTSDPCKDHVLSSWSLDLRCLSSQFWRFIAFQFFQKGLKKLTNKTDNMQIRLTGFRMIQETKT